MRVTPATPLHRCAMTAGAVLTVGALLAGCSEDGDLGELLDSGDSEEAAEDVQEDAEETLEGAQEEAEEAVDDATSDGEDTESGDGGEGEGADSEQDPDADGETAEGDGEDEGWWDTIVSWFSSDDEEGEDTESADGEGGEGEGEGEGGGGEAAEEDAQEENAEEDSDTAAEEDNAEGDGEDEGWWDTIVSWFSSDDEEGEDTESADGEGGEGSEEEDGETPAYGLPESCAEAGAAEAGGELVPFGATVQEEAGEFEELAEAAYLTCAWETEGESFTVVYTENADPSSLVDLADEAGEQEMNWEVDVDVDVENYRSTEADELGGDLDYSSTVDDSTQIMHLSLPDNFYVAAVSIGQDATQQDLERVVYDAADRL